MRYATTASAALTIASSLLVNTPLSANASPFPDPFDRRYADNSGIIDGLVASHPNLAIRQAPAPPANLPNATGLSYAVPPPNSNGGKAWKDAHGRAVDLVQQMTIEEKVSFASFACDLQKHVLFLRRLECNDERFTEERYSASVAPL